MEIGSGEKRGNPGSRIKWTYHRRSLDWVSQEEDEHDDNFALTGADLAAAIENANKELKIRQMYEEAKNHRPVTRHMSKDMASHEMSDSDTDTSTDEQWKKYRATLVLTMAHIIPQPILSHNIL